MTELLLRLFVKDYKQTEKESVRNAYGLLGSFFGLFSNLFLFLAKIIIGVLMGMYSIVADSVNNLSDFGNNALAIFGFKMSSKAPDKDHPFGHQRMEYVVSLVIACVIIALGVVMAYQGIIDLLAFIQSMQQNQHPLLDTSFVDENGNKLLTNMIVTVVILVLAVFIKLLQSLLYASLGKRIQSMELKALSKDSRNDVISTILVLVGITIRWCTSYDVDCFFTLAVSVLVVVSGIGILKDAANILIGQSPDKELIEKMIALIEKHEEILGLHDLTMHYYGNVIFAVIHAEVDASKPVMESHEVCDTIEREVYNQMGILLTIHIDPILVHDPETDLYHQAVKETLHAYCDKISIHDFRIVSAKNYVNLVFDLVIPNEMDNEKGREKIKEVLLEAVDGKINDKKVYLVIQFDDSLQDFLAGTEAEKNN